MKYRIDWFDSANGKSKTLTVQTAKAAGLVLDTLNRSVYADHVQVTHIKPGRMREYVIVLDK